MTGGSSKFWSIIRKWKTTLPSFKASVSCKSWKHKIVMWHLITSKYQQVIVVLIELLESNINVEKQWVGLLRANDDGVTMINDCNMNVFIEKLDSIFQSETIDEAYSTYFYLYQFLGNRDWKLGNWLLWKLI